MNPNTVMEQPPCNGFDVMETGEIPPLRATYFDLLYYQRDLNTAASVLKMPEHAATFFRAIASRLSGAANRALNEGRESGEVLLVIPLIILVPPPEPDDEEATT